MGDSPLKAQSAIRLCIACLVFTPVVGIAAHGAWTFLLNIMLMTAYTDLEGQLEL
jgi:hypothetical protein